MTQNPAALPSPEPTPATGRPGEVVIGRGSNRLFRLICVGLIVALSTGSARAQMRTFDTEHYRIHTDIERGAAAEYGRRLDAMYREYDRRLAGFAPDARQKFEVHLFAKRADYIKFTGNRVPNSAGIFIPSQRVLAGFEEGQGRAGLRQTLQHEAFHQFAWEGISKDLPIWLDEGLAQVFEEGVWTGEQFILGQVPPRRLEQIQKDVSSDRFVPFRDLLAMSRKDFQARMRDPAVGQAQYDQAWAMTHFLIFAADENGNPRYRARLLAWLRDMHAGQDPQQAFVDNFSANIDGFQKKYRDWLANLKPTPMAVYTDRMAKLAELLRIFKSEGLQFDSVEQLRDHLARGSYHLTESRDGRTFTHDEDALVYLADINNRAWPAGRLSLDRRPASLPDIVLTPPHGSTIRVRFYKNGKSVRYELAFEVK